MILRRTLFSMVSRSHPSSLQLAELRGIAFAMPVFTISSSKPMSVEGRDLPRLVGLDVGVDEVAHVRLVRLEVEALAARLATISRTFSSASSRSLMRRDAGCVVSARSSSSATLA
jgi:hypothetical protein